MPNPCVGCGKPVPPSLGTKPRKWCTQTCRVRSYGIKSVPRKCPVSFPTCAICSTVFVGRPGGRKGRARETCSDACRVALICRKQAQRHANMTTEQRELRKERKHQRRAKEYGVEAEQFKSREVFERDGWVCGICDQPVDPDLLYPDRLCASLDHIVPLSLGGAHTRENTRCSHLHCNIARSNRVEVAA